MIALHGSIHLATLMDRTSSTFGASDGFLTLLKAFRLRRSAVRSGLLPRLTMRPSEHGSNDSP